MNGARMLVPPGAREGTVAEIGGFKHISVSSDDEDDIVIRAGVAATSDEDSAIEEPVTAAAAPAISDNSQPAMPHSKVSSSLSDSQAVAESHPQSEGAAASSTVRGNQPKPVESAKAPKREGYRETTLEDLSSQPMPKVQKIVIACAVVAVIAAVAYYFAFMR